MAASMIAVNLHVQDFRISDAKKGSRGGRAWGGFMQLLAAVPDLVGRQARDLREF